MSELSIVSPDSVVLNTSPVVLGVLHVVSSAVGNPAVKIPPTERQFLQNLIKESPETFHVIDTALHEILKDDKIDYHDIPQIVLIMSNIFYEIKSAKCIDLVVVIQVVLDIILDSGLLHIPAFEIVILKRVIDASVGLLKTNLTPLSTIILSAETAKKTSIWNCCLR